MTISSVSNVAQAYRAIPRPTTGSVASALSDGLQLDESGGDEDDELI
jgi:hypothetical protein